MRTKATHLAALQKRIQVLESAASQHASTLAATIKARDAAIRLLTKCKRQRNSLVIDCLKLRDGKISSDDVLYTVTALDAELLNDEEVVDEQC